MADPASEFGDKFWNSLGNLDSSEDNQGASNDRFTGAVDPSTAVNTQPAPPPSAGPTPDALMNQAGGVSGPSKSLAPEAMAPLQSEAPAVQPQPQADNPFAVLANTNLSQLPPKQQMQLLQEITNYQGGYKLDPKLEMKRHEASLMSQDAIKKQAEVAAERSRQEAIILRDHNNRAEQSVQDQEVAQAENKDAADKAQQKFVGAIQEYKQISKVNPNRLMQRLGTGGQIMAAIAQAFGAFGSAITHSPNYAMELIQKAIDRDIHAQEQDIASAKTNVDMAHNMVSFYRAKGMDIQQAAAAGRATLWSQAQQKISEITAGLGEKTQLAMGQQLLAAAQANEAKELQQNYILQQGKFTKQSVYQYPGAGGAGRELPQSAAKDLGEANAAIQAALDLHKEWDKSASGVYGFVTSLLPNTDASRYEKNRAMTKQIIGKYMEGGVLRKEDESKYDKFLPEAGDSKETALFRRNSLIKLLAERASSEKKAYKQAGFNVDNITVDAKPPTSFKPLSQ